MTEYVDLSKTNRPTIRQAAPAPPAQRDSALLAQWLSPARRPLTMNEMQRSEDVKSVLPATDPRGNRPTPSDGLGSPDTAAEGDDVVLDATGSGVVGGGDAVVTVDIGSDIFEPADDVADRSDASQVGSYRSSTCR